MHAPAFSQDIYEVLMVQKPKIEVQIFGNKKQSYHVNLTAVTLGREMYTHNNTEFISCGLERRQHTNESEPRSSMTCEDGWIEELEARVPTYCTDVCLFILYCIYSGSLTYVNFTTVIFTTYCRKFQK